MEENEHNNENQDENQSVNIIDIIEENRNIMVHWAQSAKDYVLEHNEIYGYSWGDPNSNQALDGSGNELGNYRKIRDEYIIPNCLGGTVMDLGALSGKWTQYMRFADKVIYADVDMSLYCFIKRLIKMNMDFYPCNGINLVGIEDNSIDFLLVMDSFMRTNKIVIEGYVNEFKRVLKPKGRAVIMLPINIKSGSLDRGFTDISMEYIQFLFEGLNYQIDTDTITHGCLVLINF